jgi:hypothetical protein
MVELGVIPLAMKEIEIESSGEESESSSRLSQEYFPPDVGKIVPDGHYLPSWWAVQVSKGVSRAIFEPHSNVFLGRNHAPNHRLVSNTDLSKLPLEELTKKIGFPPKNSNLS